MRPLPGRVVNCPCLIVVVRRVSPACQNLSGSPCSRPPTGAGGVVGNIHHGVCVTAASLVERLDPRHGCGFVDDEMDPQACRAMLRRPRVAPQLQHS